jgi:hypothetical protein
VLQVLELWEFDGVQLMSALQSLAWPLAVVILGMYGIYVFRRPIEGLMDRTQQIKAAGVEALTSAQVSHQQTERVRIDEVLKAYDSPMLRIREDEIVQQLNALKLSGPQERERVLVRHLATLLIAMDFDSKYRAIFGSQLLVLEQLNTRSEGATPQEIKPIYDQAAARSPDVYEGFSFDQWVAFLSHSQLVREESDRVYLTVAGREFLKYVVDRGYTFAKLY